MPNKNYINGSNLERSRKKDWEGLGYFVMKSGGSRGPFDLIAIREGKGLPILIQVKRVATRSQANLLLKKFKETPPLKPGDYMQRMEILITNEREIAWCSV